MDRKYKLTKNSKNGKVKVTNLTKKGNYFLVIFLDGTKGIVNSYFGGKDNDPIKVRPMYFKVNCLCFAEALAKLKSTETDFLRFLDLCKYIAYGNKVSVHPDIANIVDNANFDIKPNREVDIMLNYDDVFPEQNENSGETTGKRKSLTNGSATGEIEAQPNYFRKHEGE